jgi:hypothetical protein
LKNLKSKPDNQPRFGGVRFEASFFGFGLPFGGLCGVLNPPQSAASKRAWASLSE